MSVFTFHLVKANAITVSRTLWNPPNASNVEGLIHCECMAGMTLGSPIFSPSRILLRQLVVFAQWENESAIDNFLATNNLRNV